jgi:hypothetical protein
MRPAAMKTCSDLAPWRSVMSRANAAFSVLLLALFVVPPSGAQDPAERQPPKALLAFREARQQIVSGRVDWTVELPDRARTMHYVSRYAANGDLIFENRGDEDGWTRFFPGGRSGSSKFPHLYLATPEGIWLYRETSAGATLWPPGSPETSMKPELKDARAIGIFSTSESIETPLASRGAWESKSDPVMSYEQHDEGDLVIVTGQHRSGATTEWTIAPDMGWNAVRIVSESPNGKRTCVENEMCRFGDVWLPKHTVYQRDDSVEAVVSIQGARLNQSDDPRTFTPNDIGLEPGIAVSSQTARIGSRIRFWNGEEIIPAERYHREVELGLLTPGKVWRQLVDDGYLDSPYVTGQERKLGALNAAKRTMQEGVRAYQALWRSYTESFIQCYNLNDEQQQKARAILADCERRAEPIAEKLESHWSEIHKQLDGAVRNADAERTKQLRDKWKELQKPLNEIFANRLVPELEKLPTRAQKQAHAAQTKQD